MLPLLHAGWRRGRAVASGLRHPYQVRRLRTVFGSGRACRNSCDFRQPPRPERRKLPGLPARDSRRSPPGHPRLYRSRQAPAIAPVACSCRITAIAAAPPPHPPYITPSPQTPPFSHIIRTRRHPHLTRPRSPPVPASVSRARSPPVPARRPCPLPLPARAPAPVRTATSRPPGSPRCSCAPSKLP